MPRAPNYPYNYSYPSGTPGVSGQPISSTAYNNFLSDLQTTFNTVQPLNYGGTGANTALGGWDALNIQGNDIASSSTINLNSAGPYFNLTGTTTVTSVTLDTGKMRTGRAVGAVQFTASSTLVVNGSTSTNTTTIANDYLTFEGGAAGVVYVWTTAHAGSTFLDSVFRIQDNGDTTKQLAFEVSGITTGTTRTATPPDASFKMAALDVASQTITGGAVVTSNAAGTVSSGTVTLNPGTRPIWDYTNNGAHTLAPGANVGTIVLDITNGASAGAITTSGWTRVLGAFDTTNAHKFTCFCKISSVSSLLQIVPMQ